MFYLILIVAVIFGLHYAGKRAIAAEEATQPKTVRDELEVYAEQLRQKGKPVLRVMKGGNA